MTITQLRDLAGYGPVRGEDLRSAFVQRDGLRAVYHLVQRLAASGQDADVCVFENPGRERWILNVRTTGGEAPPEQHRDWHDLSLYLLGGNDVRVGGELKGAREVSDGEWREGTLTGGNILPVRPGDLLWTPAGIPHQSHFLPQTAFVIVKIRAGAEAASELLVHVHDLKEPAHMPQFAKVPV